MTIPIGIPTVLELHPDDGVSENVANEAAVIGLNLSGSLPPLICLRAWRNEVGRYRNLAVALGPDQPIYAASPPRGEAQEDFPSDTEEWARLFMDALGPLLGGEPLILCGWSYAGVVALKIAEYLEAEGRAPVLVNLIDTTMPVAKPRGDRRKRGKFHNFIVQLNRSLEIPERGVRVRFLLAYGKRVMLRIMRSLRRRIPALFQKLPGQASPPAAEQGEIQYDDPLKRSIRVGFLKSRPEPTTLSVALYWTQQSQTKLGDSSLGWCLRVFGDFRSYPIAGDHLTLFEPDNVESLATRLRDEMRLAVQRGVDRSSHSSRS